MPQLYVVAIQPATGQTQVLGRVSLQPDRGHPMPVPIAGPANLTDDPWSFAPLSPGLTMQGGSKYIFLIVGLQELPSPPPSTPPSPPPGTGAIGRIVAALSFNGTTFSIVAHQSCGHRGLGGIPPYAAPTSGPLTLSASVSVTPTCVPSPLPSASSLPQLYVYAIALHGKGRGHGLSRRGGGGGKGHFNGVPIAGPANLTDNPWSFAPLSPGLTMVKGAKYDFVIAIPKTPRHGHGAIRRS